MNERKIRSGVLSYEDIKLLKLILEPSDKCEQIASYDLRLGSKHFVFEESGKWKAVFLGEPDELAEENEGITDPSLILCLPHQGAGNLVIPAFGSAIIELEEVIDLYSAAKRGILVSGRFDLKLKSIYKGLISQQATQVEPCYKGKLYCFIHNLGSNAVSIQRHEKIATIEFSYVNIESDGTKKSTARGARKGDSTVRCSVKVKADRKNDAEIITEYIAKTIEENDRKFANAPRFALIDGEGKNATGIGDVRWLFIQGMLPTECGMAPIFNLANGKVEAAVEDYLGKSDTVDKLSNRVGDRISEKQNAIKIVVSLVVAVITFFTTGFLTEVMAELRYFREELTFFAESSAREYMSQGALNAIEDHTKELQLFREKIVNWSVIAIIIIVGLLLILFFVYMRPMYERKWQHKQKKIESKSLFRTKRLLMNKEETVKRVLKKYLRRAERIRAKLIIEIERDERLKVKNHSKAKKTACIFNRNKQKTVDEAKIEEDIEQKKVKYGELSKEILAIRNHLITNDVPSTDYDYSKLIKCVLDASDNVERKKKKELSK